jgi:dinuclear metal center YbgI/SA1388 family protein
MKRNDLQKFLNQLLKPYDYQDYGPNGLQIEGTKEIEKIAFAVSATKESVEKCLEHQCQALIVHHGLFWKFHGPKTITGAFYGRVAPLIKSDINLFGYHLPLDGNLEVGNAATLANKIGLKNIIPFGDYKGSFTGVLGECPTSDGIRLKKDLESLLSHPVLHSDAQVPIKKLAIITGGANSEWIQAKRAGAQAYLTGEMSEHDWHEAKESGVHMFAGGHHNTEKFGIQALQQRIENEFPGLKTIFFDSDNPA